jgi:hypothetical protein
MTDPEKPPDDVLWHQSGVNPRGEPFVQLLRGDKIMAQMSTAQARDHAHAILEAAEAAEQDAFLMDFARNVMGMPFQDAGKILMALRDYRAKTTGKSQGPLHPRDWVMPEPEQQRKYSPEFDFTKKDPRKP